MGTHWKNLANYDYLGAYSLEGTPSKEVVLTMNDIKVELVTAEGGEKENCIVCRFEESQVGNVVVKPMVLNKTNCKIIESLYGPEIENWIGKSVIIYSTTTKFRRDIVPCLRIKKEVPAFKCSVCGKDIEKKVYAASINKYGVALCSSECLENYKNGVVESTSDNVQEGVNN